MHNGISRWLLVLSALSVLLSACSDDPTEQNALLTPQLPFVEMAVRETTIVATGGSTFKQASVMNGTINLVGRSGKYSASTLLAFYANNFPNRDTVNVISATLTLHGASFHGDSTGLLDFTVHRLDRTWNQGTLTWDSVQTGLYDASAVRGSYSGRVGLDTQRVEITLDTTMARQWLATPSTTEYTFRYGMILVPTASATVVRGFRSFETDSAGWVPTVRLICLNTAGTVRDTADYNLGIDTFVGNADGLDTDPTLFYAQAGIVYRSIVNFDVSMIPRGAIINSATLTLQSNPATSWLNRFAADSALAVHLMQGATTTSGFEATSSSATHVPGSATLYAADLAHAVQSWVRGPNYGALLRIGGVREFESFDLVTLYNHTADASRKPRLKIIYAVPKN